jgi:hypothetical protein
VHCRLEDLPLVAESLAFDRTITGFGRRCWLCNMILRNKNADCRVKLPKRPSFFSLSTTVILTSWRTGSAAIHMLL